jgi:hypothetical protein
MKQVQARLRQFKFPPTARAYRAVLRQLKAGTLRDAYALRDALNAALKKYSSPRK